MRMNTYGSNLNSIKWGYSLGPQSRTYNSTQTKNCADFVS